MLILFKRGATSVMACLTNSEDLESGSNPTLASVFYPPH